MDFLFSGFQVGFFLWFTSHCVWYQSRVIIDTHEYTFHNINIIITIVGNQMINNEVVVYGSHFGAGLEAKYPSIYNATLPRGRPSKENDGVRLQRLQSVDGFKFMSISKNRHFGKGI